MKAIAIALASAFALVLSGCGSGGGDTGAGGSTPEPGKSSAAKAPTFKDLVVTDDAAALTPKTTFGKDTPNIIVSFGFSDVPSGSKLRGVWICEKSDVTPPNFKIDEATLDVGTLTNTAKFALSKPNKGWPAGDYRTELYCDDKLIETVKFKIE